MNNYQFHIIFLVILISFISCNKQNIKADHHKPFNNSKNASLELAANSEMIFHDKKGNYWFLSKDKGIYKYDGNELILFTLNDGICSNSIISVQEDKNGHLYFDSANGICKYDGKNFIKLNPNMSLNNKWQSKADDLWFSMGWEHSGPFRYDGKNLYYLEFPKNPQEKTFDSKYPNVSFNPYGIYRIYKDQKGNIWLGTSSMGLYLFDGKDIYWKYEKQWTELSEERSFGIRSIIEDKEGYYWICNTKNKYQLLDIDTSNHQELKSIPFKTIEGLDKDENSELYFLNMEIDNDGNIWMLTYNQGLWKNNGQTLEPFFININNNKITPNSMYLDRKGILWLGTKNNGVYTFNGKSFKKFEI